MKLLITVLLVALFLPSISQGVMKAGKRQRTRYTKQKAEHRDGYKSKADKDNKRMRGYDCKTDEHRMLPSKLVYNLINFEEDFSVEWDDPKKKEKIRIKFPRFFKHCMDVEVKVNPVGNNIYISVLNKENSLIDYDDSKRSELKFNEKYEQCLRDEDKKKRDAGETPVLEDDNESFNYVKENFGSKRINRAVDIDLKKDKTMHVYFSAPPILTDQYKGPMFKQSQWRGPEEVCGVVEHFKEDPVVLHSAEDVDINRYYQACDSGESLEIKKAIDDIADLGPNKKNMKLIAEILKREYTKALAEEAEDAATDIIKQITTISKIDIEDEEDIKSSSDDLKTALTEYTTNLIEPIEERILELKERQRQLALVRNKGTSKEKAARKILNKATREELKALETALKPLKRKFTKSFYKRLGSVNDYNALKFKKFEARIKVYSDVARAASRQKVAAKKVTSSDFKAKYTKKINKIVNKFEEGDYDFYEKVYDQKHGYGDYTDDFKGRAEKAQARYDDKEDRYNIMKRTAWHNHERYCSTTYYNRTKCKKAKRTLKKLPKYKKRLRKAWNIKDDKQREFEIFEELDIELKLKEDFYLYDDIFDDGDYYDKYDYKSYDDVFRDSGSYDKQLFDRYLQQQQQQRWFSPANTNYNNLFGTQQYGAGTTGLSY